jgi:hypothetical protein
MKNCKVGQIGFPHSALARYPVCVRRWCYRAARDEHSQGLPILLPSAYRYWILTLVIVAITMSTSELPNNHP